MSEILTTKQVAEMFKVDSRTVLYNFIPKGLKYFKVGNRDYRFTIEDIENFIQKQRQEKQKTEFVDTRTEHQKKMNRKLKVV